MIDRYARPEMAAVWADERRLELWLDVELAATRSRERHGDVPAGTADRVRATARLDLARVVFIARLVARLVGRGRASGRSLIDG